MDKLEQEHKEYKEYKKYEEYEDMCRMILENSQELIIFFDKDGMIINCSRSALEKLNYEDDIYHTGITDIFRKAAEYTDGMLTINKRFLDKAAETMAYRKNQTCFEVELKVVTRDMDAPFLGICIALDISDKISVLRNLKHTKTELKNSQKYKNEFLANVSHELKTPVNGICGLTEYLLGTDLDKSQRESLDLIKRCCSNMIVLINDLLDYAKIINHKLTLEKREFHFRRFINDVITMNIHQMNDKDIQLLVNISNEIPEILIGDEYRISQILNNLLSNATKFTSYGQVALEVGMTSQKEDQVELFFMVMDTGIGISKEDIDKLFISFSQVDGSITRRFGGTGLGLSICRMLVEEMGGTISVESEIGEGSTFSFSLRLGVPKRQSQNMTSPGGQDNGYKTAESGKATEDALYHEKDYLSRLLGANALEESGRKEKSGGNTMPDIIGLGSSCDPVKEYKKLSERLIVCIEMDNWEKAEEAVYIIKKLLPKENKELMDALLRLTMSVRKEDYDSSKLRLQELDNMVKGGAFWKT